MSRWRVLLIAALAAVLALLQPWAGVSFAAQEDMFSLFDHKGVIRKGDRGSLVRSAQEALSTCGYVLAIDGIFGPSVEQAVRRFQGEFGLLADGIVGPATLAALSKRYYQLRPPQEHKVKPGETLWEIGDRYGLTARFLADLNSLAKPDLLYAGQILLLVAPESAEPQDVPRPPPEPDPFPAPDKRICLTFDDGPDPATTPSILATLARYGVKATFFLIGEKVLRYEELARDIALAGHTIGIHGHEHKVLSGLSRDQVSSDLARAQSAVLSATGTTPFLYRPPYGALDQVQVAEAAKLGMRVVMWTNIGGADLGAQGPDEVAAWTLSAASDGGILLLHEGLPHTTDALGGIIEGLARAGYGFQNPGR